MSAGPIAVVAALAEELAPLAGRLERVRRERLGAVSCRRGRMAGCELALAVTGEGAAAAAVGAGGLLDGLKPAVLLGIGVAGGLSPGLPAGALLAAREVVDASGEVRRADRQWLRRAVATGRAVEGRLATVERVVASAAAKRRLWQRLGGGEALGVDLESAAWATAAESRGVPWLVVRAILDPSGEELPLPFDRLAAPGGGISRPRVLGYLSLRPWRLPAVLDLRLRLRRLAGQLAGLVEELAT